MKAIPGDGSAAGAAGPGGRRRLPFGSLFTSLITPFAACPLFVPSGKGTAEKRGDRSRSWATIGG